MLIREASEADLQHVLAVETKAFGEPDEAQLVANLLKDPSAKPVLSLLAFQNEQAVGHILFTSAKIETDGAVPVCSLLAPLAVTPEAQNQGIGGKLIAHGLNILAKAGVDLVFVLGHPGYYPRHGFKTAGHLGYEAPYPIPQKDADAWMVQELRPGIIGTSSGKLRCAVALDKPELWVE